MYSINRILWPHCVTINQQFRANTETEMHICGSPLLHSFRPLNSLNITFKTLTEKHGECIHTAYEALCTLLHAFFYSVRLFLSLLVNGGCTMISISHFPLNSFELVRLICFLFGCLHFLSSLSLSLPVALASPPSVRPSAFNSQCIQTRQVAQSLWGWSLASSQTASSQPPALTARGASTLSPGTLSLPDWTSRGRRTPGLLHTTIAPSGSRWAKPQSVINGKTNRSVAEDNCFCLCCLSRSIWRRQSAWRASSLRGPKTSGWCSLCRCSKSPTVTMESRGVWWRRRAPAMIRSDICDYLTQYPACSSEWISPISTGENNLFFRHLPVWDFGYAAPITCLLSD